MLKRLLPFIPLIFFIACVPAGGGIDPSYQTAVVQSLTATMWTPTPITPTATPVPNTTKIAEVLNSALDGPNTLAATIEAKFSIIDVQIFDDGTIRQAGILSIHIECEWIYNDSCTPEESFVALINALTSNDKTFEKVTGELPTTIHTLQVTTSDHMIPSGMIVANWSDVVAYAHGDINGNQLGGRIVRMTTP